MLPRDVTTVKVDFSALEEAYKATLRPARAKPEGHFTREDLAKAKEISKWQAEEWVRVGLQSGLIELAGKWGAGNAHLYRFTGSHA